jgi:hypothetical protein
MEFNNNSFSVSADFYFNNHGTFSFGNGAPNGLAQRRRGIGGRRLKPRERILGTHPFGRRTAPARPPELVLDGARRYDYQIHGISLFVFF